MNTGERIAKWGIGDGSCPFPQCNVIESMHHLFLECYRVTPILAWTNRVLHISIGKSFNFSESKFMFGYPRSNTKVTVFNRIWFMFCVVKFVLWKSRCSYKYEDKLLKDEEIISLITKEIKDRIWADRSGFRVLNVGKFGSKDLPSSN